MARTVNKFGFAENVNSVPTIIWTGHLTGGNIMPDSPGALTIQSSSIEDAAGQTGATALVCRVLSLVDGIYRTGRIIATLNGTSNATILTPEEDVDTSAVFRVFLMVLTGPSGSTESNVGVITAFIDGTGASEIPVGIGISEMSFFSIGGDETATAWIVESSLIDPGAQPGTGVTRFRARRFGESIIGIGQPALLSEFNPVHTEEFPKGAPLSSNTDYWTEVTELSGGPLHFAARTHATLSSIPKDGWVPAP